MAVALLAVALLVGTVVVRREEAAARADAHARAHDAAADLVATGDARSSLARLRSQIASLERTKTRHDIATVKTYVALDELQSLRDRIQLAEFELARARDVSVMQASHLRIVRGCVAMLELARSRLIGDDPGGATAALAAGGSACQRAEALSEEVTAAHPFDFPDPYVMRVDHTYYAFATNGPAGTVQVVSSDDLGDWRVRGSALAGVPSWAQAGFTWAPSVIRTFGPDYVMFYTVRHKVSGKQCISRATSTAPEGPYRDTSTEPLVCQLGHAGSIDPSPYAHEGTMYLTWKSEGETAGGGAQIWMAPLSTDGSKLAWFPTKLLDVDRDWEGRTIEGPSMGMVDGKWVLIYSANRWDSADYATGYADCDGPKGPCHKPENNQVLRSDDHRAGPGGAEFFRTADGQTKVAYAAWDTGEVGIPNARRLHLGTVSMTPLGLRIT